MYLLFYHPYALIRLLFVFHNLSFPMHSLQSLSSLDPDNFNTHNLSVFNYFPNLYPLLYPFIIYLVSSLILHLVPLLNKFTILANSTPPSNYHWVSILLSFISALPHFIISLAGPASPPPDPASLMAQFSLSSPFPQRAVPLLPRSPLLPSSPATPHKRATFP